MHDIRGCGRTFIGDIDVRPKRLGTYIRRACHYRGTSSRLPWNERSTGVSRSAHSSGNFRKERQICFYADKLNVSTAYLSRLVKEISGSTVNDHVSSLLYKEICNLLKQSDMTMGEIADSLHFSDQSALSNFFKLRSGMSPLAYRNQ